MFTKYYWYICVDTYQQAPYPQVPKTEVNYTIQTHNICTYPFNRRQL